MGVLNLIGIILVLIGMKGLADFYGEREIFNNALYGFIFGIIGVVVAIALFVMAFLSGISWGMFMVPEMSFSLDCNRGGNLRLDCTSNIRHY